MAEPAMPARIRSGRKDEGIKGGGLGFSAFYHIYGGGG
jgi:hypothetical protein